MSTDTKPLSPRPLSLRHERFVAEFLRSGNATQAYLRAGYSPRGAQPSASRLLRDPRIEAAIAAGRQRISEALEVDVTRLAQEYAKIAFANVADYVSVDANGRVRIDLEKASLAQQAGIVELKVVTNSKQEQRVTLKLGKLPALAALTKNIGVLVAKPEPGLTAEDRQRYEQRCADYQCQLDHRKEQHWRSQDEIHALQKALAEAQAAPRRHSLENPNPSAFETPYTPSPCDPPEPQPQPAVMPGMPTGPLPDHTPGLYPNAKFVWSGGRQPWDPPDSAEALRTMKPGGFPGR